MRPKNKDTLEIPQNRNDMVKNPPPPPTHTKDYRRFPFYPSF